MKKLLPILLMMILAACAPTANSGSSAGGIKVNDPWARPAKAGANSAIYFVIENPQAQVDALLSARCEAAMMTEVHMTKTDDAGKSMMMKQDSVPVAASGQTKFEPGGLHVMLMNLKEDLEPGQKLPVTLNFEKAGEVTVEATVREP